MTQDWDNVVLSSEYSDGLEVKVSLQDTVPWASTL